MNYKVLMSLTDLGPYYSRLILPLGTEVTEDSISPAYFNVYCECIDPETGRTAVTRIMPQNTEVLLKGYPEIAAAWPCDENGNRTARGCFAALELTEETLNKPITGNVLSSKRLEHRYRITQLRTIRGCNGDVNGLVFDTCEERLCPELEGWSNGSFTSSAETGSITLGYGWFDPTAKRPAPSFFPPKTAVADLCPFPLLIWLHGAGEGGLDPEIAYTGNYVTGIAGSSIQRSLGGAACILVPQCPTVWMDNGSEKLGRSNRSIYAAPLMELIRSFIEAHKDIIDTDRIWIGGLSNGGFLTLRMTADYPGFFAGAVPVCAPFYPENASQAEVDAIAATPTWFVHCKGDELVPPEETSFPLYAALRKAGAADLHFTLFDHVYDVTGKYRNADGSVRHFFSHGVWMPVYRDACITDFDGTKVMENGVPVSLWEWLGHRTR